MSGYAAFCCRRDDGLGQCLILFQAFRKFISVDIALAERISIPQRGRRNACDKSSHDDFNWKRIEDLNNRRIWIGKGDDMILIDVLCLLKPPRRKLIQYL